MNPVSRYLGTVRTLINTRRAKTKPCFVIQKRHSLRPMYYSATFWDYQWVKNIDRATVFRSEAEVEREIRSTWIDYEDLYDIVAQ